MRAAIVLVVFSLSVGSASAGEKLKFVVKSPQWGSVAFTFQGTKACAENRGERMCGTADRIPRPGENFVMSWNWPQKKWTRP
ncbi:MAG: hypothetical protein ACK4U0_08040 [Mesorhizobium sp.]